MAWLIGDLGSLRLYVLVANVSTTFMSLSHKVTVSSSSLHTPSTNNTNWAFLPSKQLLGKQMWQQRCTHHFPTETFTTWRISPLLMAIKSIFGNFGYIFSKFITFPRIPAKTNLSGLSTQKYYKQPKVQIISITQTTTQCKISVYQFQNTKSLRRQRPTGLIHIPPRV